MKHKYSLLFACFSCFLVLVGCSEKEKTNVEVEERLNEEPTLQKHQKEEQRQLEQTKEEQTFKYNHPLTGIGTNEESSQRVFSVMVNNHPKARPQSGLHKADLVYEVLAEGFISRFLAIYQSELPEIVGPIRSSRDYYIELSKGYDTIYIAYGGSEEALHLLDRDVTDYLNGIKYKNGRRSFEDDPFYYLSDSRNRPHNTYMTSEKMIEGAAAHGYDLTQEIEPLPFLDKDEMQRLSGDTAKEVQIVYSSKYDSSVRYVFDEEEEKYERYNGKNQTIDLETNTPIMVDNLFIIEAPHKVVDNAGRRDINFKDGGKGYLVQKGTYQEVTWENIDGRILPFKEGEPLNFVPGQTWINVVPTDPGIDSSVTFSE